LEYLANPVFDSHTAGRGLQLNLSGGLLETVCVLAEAHCLDIHNFLVEHSGRGRSRDIEVENQYFTEIIKGKGKETKGTEINRILEVYIVKRRGYARLNLEAERCLPRRF
jgi:hypothetical protein